MQHAMTPAQTRQILDEAANTCRADGSRLTDKRRKVLECLLHAGKPVSAYEIADLYEAQFGESIRPMSVYRMLDFLVEESLAHKLKSANKYVPCSHIVCDHDHELPQFLICERCERVEEIAIGREVLDTLAARARKADFELTSPQIELNCICHQCLEPEDRDN
jgi:Fur family zinc uptake transcriptional regulator